MTIQLHRYQVRDYVEQITIGPIASVLNGLLAQMTGWSSSGFV